MRKDKLPTTNINDLPTEYTFQQFNEAFKRQSQERSSSIEHRARMPDTHAMCRNKHLDHRELSPYCLRNQKSFSCSVMWAKMHEMREGSVYWNNEDKDEG